LSRAVFRIAAGFLVGALVFLATALSLSEYYLDEEARLLAAGDLQGALEVVQTAARLDPFDPEPLKGKSFILQQQGRYEDAASSVRNAIERDPHNYILYLMLGNLQFTHMDDLDAAVKSYRGALRLNPNATVASNALAQAHMRRGDLGAAKEVYERLETEERISFQGLYNLGRIYVRTGEPGEGLESIERAKREAETGLRRLEGPLKTRRQELIESMELAIADALVVQGRYAEAREAIVGSSSEQAPALLQLLNSNPEAYREAVVSSEIY
jgi:tetratricopeptide (TPR) repeat protein